METVTVPIGSDDNGRRLDRVLRKYLSSLPLSALHRLLRKGSVRLDGERVDGAVRVRTGQTLSFPSTRNESEQPGVRNAERPPANTAADLRVAFENEHLLVVDKAAGVLTHGEGGLDESVLAYLAGKLPPSLSFRPGPLHRLDRGTSGLVAFSKSIDGARRFSAAIAERRIAKRYLAVIKGTLRGSELWEDRLERDRGSRTTSVADRPEDGSDAAGKAASTRATGLANDGSSTLALLDLGTGRTHQIRVQAAARGYPLLGDRKYGGPPLPGGFLLHAYELAAEESLEAFFPKGVTAPPPPRFLEFVRRRFGEEWFETLSAGLPSVRLIDAIM